MRKVSAAIALAMAPAIVVPANAAGLFTSRSASQALVANCPSGPLGNVCNPNYVFGSNSFPGYTGVEDYHPTQFGFGAESYAILKPTPTSLSNGSAIAFNVLDPGSKLPSLKAGSFTRANELGRYTTSYAFSSVLAAFTYTGAEAQPLSLVGDIDYLLSFAPINYGLPFAPGSFPYSFGQIRGRLVIGSEELYQGTTLQPDAMVCGATGVLASGSGFSGIGGYASGWGGTTHGLNLTLDASTACGGGGPVMINPGDNFYVYAFLETLAIQGAGVNATNSLNIDFAAGTPQSVRDAFAVGAQAVGVPEPANWALLIVGFGLTGAVMRRRQATVATSA